MVIDKDKSTIWIFSIEPLETRYTAEWHEHLPHMLTHYLGEQFNVVQVDGVQKDTEPTPGAFLNFADTNYWKSSQLCKFLESYNAGDVGRDDHFVFADAWNPTVVQLRYMNDLMGTNWKLHGLFHAGSYDPADFLGRLVGDTPWVRHAEKSFFHAFDHNYFATDFHIKMFCDNLLAANEDDMYSYSRSGKIIRSGWPMQYMKPLLFPYTGVTKENIIVFPHRVSEEKQPEIFRDLAESLPEYEFIVCQDSKLTKEEYHNILSRAKILFSANLQETLGITTCAEGPLLGVVPFAPNRLSYTEIFENHQEFLYNEEWTRDWDSYMENKSKVVDAIKNIMENYESYLPVLDDYVKTAYNKFFNAKTLIENIQNR